MVVCRVVVDLPQNIAADIVQNCCCPVARLVVDPTLTVAPSAGNPAADNTDSPLATFAAGIALTIATFAANYLAAPPTTDLTPDLNRFAPDLINTDKTA